MQCILEVVVLFELAVTVVVVGFRDEVERLEGCRWLTESIAQRGCMREQMLLLLMRCWYVRVVVRVGSHDVVQEASIERAAVPWQ
jgi:hypothetical protein